MKDFILCSVARITPLTWNTFSCSNKLFSLLRTYRRQKLLIKTNIYFSNQKRKNLSFFTTVLSFKLKKYQHNTSTAACKLYSNFPETYLQSFPIVSQSFSRHICTLHHLRCRINNKSTEMQSNIMPKNDNNNAKIVCLLL